MHSGDTYQRITRIRKLVSRDIYTQQTKLRSVHFVLLSVVQTAHRVMSNTILAR